VILATHPHFVSLQKPNLLGHVDNGFVLVTTFSIIKPVMSFAASRQFLQYRSYGVDRVHTMHHKLSDPQFNIKLLPEFIHAKIFICVTYHDKPGEVLTQITDFKFPLVGGAMWCWGGDNTSRLCPSSGILKKHTF
jgi:hypothetical protein